MLRREVSSLTPAKRIDPVIMIGSELNLREQCSLRLITMRLPMTISTSMMNGIDMFACSATAFRHRPMTIAHIARFMKKYKMLSRTSMLMNVFTRKLEVPGVVLLSLILLKETLMAKKKSKISKQRTGMNR